jgi:hypothetical protein
MKFISLSKEEFEVQKSLGAKKFAEMVKTWSPLKRGGVLHLHRIKFPNDKPTSTN